MAYKQQGAWGSRIKMTLKLTKRSAWIVCCERVAFVYSLTSVLCEAVLKLKRAEEGSLCYKEISYAFKTYRDGTYYLPFTG